MACDTRAWLRIHFLRPALGLHAILGTLITRTAFPPVLWCMALVTADHFRVSGFWRRRAEFSGRPIAIYAGIGVRPGFMNGGPE